MKYNSNSIHAEKNYQDVYSCGYHLCAGVTKSRWNFELMKGEFFPNLTKEKKLSTVRMPEGEYLIIQLMGEICHTDVIFLLEKSHQIKTKPLACF